ncbi:MAG: protease SohB [Legionellaceae bacterium]|nr:protease SohB [Legionellaceae bacterium]HCA89069.1 protease SohB [Legionellales bacterium]|tara:strand:+ start:1826 stop:2785 length:960 start_codon:yes stop_codon:yes gene_type:complete
MGFLTQYGLFLLKTLTLVIAFLITFAGFIALSRKPRKPKLEIISLNKQFFELKAKLIHELGGKKPAKFKPSKEKKPHLFVVEFTGDIKASQVESLRDTINAILTVATTHDEVVVKLESPGGMVSGYGLAAAQLQRIRDKNIPLTVCIDKVAASGGYLMSCVANRIIAAPFAIVGSIGVVAQLPNFHRWLKKNDIDVELVTSGEYKRTLTILGENTEKGRQKFQEDLVKIHQAFRQYILSYRDNLNIEEVATGEHWLALDAIGLGLVDKLQTSDEYLMAKMDTHFLYHLSKPTKPSLVEKFTKSTAQLFIALQDFLSLKQ